MTEPTTTPGALARLGFSRTDRVHNFLADPVLSALGKGSTESLGATADGDDAVLGLLRLAESAEAGGHKVLMDDFLASVRTAGSHGHRLIRLLGTSVALGDFLTRHPECLEALRTGDDALAMPAPVVRGSLLQAVGADPTADLPVAGEGARESATPCGSPTTSAWCRSRRRMWSRPRPWRSSPRSPQRSATWPMPLSPRPRRSPGPRWRGTRRSAGP